MAEPEHLPVQQARNGDPAAWNVLFRRYQLPLYTYVVQLLHDEQSSLDIVQDTFIAALRHIGSLREDAKFAGWLFGIAHQKCTQSWRKDTRAHAIRDEVAQCPPDYEEGPDDLLIRAEQEAEFMDLLNKLPAPQRSVLLLRFIEDFSLEHIAEITQTPIGTVKSRLYYAKRALRNLLEVP